MIAFDVLPMAFAGGSFVILAVIAVVILGIGYGYFTRAGSGIEDHPDDGLDGAPGAAGKSEPSGKDQGEGSAFDTHGTQ